MTDKLSAAISEAYASAPVDVIILDTLELRHVSFDVPARIVNDYGTLQFTTTDVDGSSLDIYGHMLTLDSDAIDSPGQTVLFQSCVFSIKLAAQQDGQVPEIEIALDNVTHLLGTALDNAVTSGQSIQATYREYLSSDLTASEAVLDGLTIQKVNATAFRLIANARFFDIINFNFTNRIYDLATFPGLIGAT